jgi:hypothetical protein
MKRPHLDQPEHPGSRSKATAHGCRNTVPVPDTMTNIAVR